MRKIVILGILILVNTLKITDQGVIDLYPKEIPNFKKPNAKEIVEISKSGIISLVIIPTLQVFLNNSYS